MNNSDVYSSVQLSILIHHSAFTSEITLGTRRL